MSGGSNRNSGPVAFGGKFAKFSRTSFLRDGKSSQAQVRITEILGNN